MDPEQDESPLSPEQRAALLAGGVPCEHCYKYLDTETVAEVDNGKDFLCHACAAVAHLDPEARARIPGLKRSISWINDYLAHSLTRDARAVLEDLKRHLVYERDHGPSTSTFTD